MISYVSGSKVILGIYGEENLLVFDLKKNLEVRTIPIPTGDIDPRQLISINGGGVLSND